MKLLNSMCLYELNGSGGLFDVEECAFENALGVRPFKFTAKIFGGEKIAAVLNQNDFEFCKEYSLGGNTVYVYSNEQYALTVEVKYFAVPDSAAVRSHAEFINNGTYTVRVCKLSSLFAGGVFGNITDRNRSALKVHFARSMWCGEGQPVCCDLDDLHVDFSCLRESSVSRKIISRTGYTTETYLPAVYFVDEESKKCWYAGVEPQGAWEIGLGIESRFGSDYRTVTVEVITGEEKTSGFYADVPPRGRYVTPHTAFGCVRGGLEDGVAQLNSYRRYLVQTGGGARQPVVFNDYMNCHWARPQEARTKRLIDAAAKAGAEVFCIDSGWYKATGEKDWFGALGDWRENNELFGRDGFAGMVSYIRDKGMAAGMWFEFEVCTPNSELANRPESWFLHFNGKRAYESGRYFLDMRNPQVTEYLKERVRRFYGMGVRYIKNDYNGTFAGCDSAGGSPFAGLEEHALAVGEFFRSLRREFPELMIENCGSGAMRADYTLLSACDIQSVSDLELFERYPAVVSGSLMHLLPEQTGVWCVCYPQVYADMQNENFADKDYVRKMADGEQTAFNMVSGMMGAMILSGRIDLADEKNLSLVREGVRLYKQKKEFIKGANPVWPCGAIKYSDGKGIKALGLKNGDTVLLALWRLKGGDKIELDMAARSARLAYPAAAATSFTLKDGKLSVAFDKDYQARLFEIKI